MLTRTIASTSMLLMMLCGPDQARAQEPLIGIDGCAILASTVYTEVTEARLGHPGGAYGNPLYAGRNEITLCTETTRMVTNAFAAALQQANVYVTWGFHSGYSGDYCLSHFLSQCYPSGNPAMPTLSVTDQSFVERSWRAVRDSVRYRMAPYAGSNVVRFRRDDLARSIRRSILAEYTENQSR